MHLRHLRLIDFRSWPLLELELQPGVTTFVGRNGHGKTNILESVNVLATLGSHRVAQDVPMIRSGAETALVGALAHNAGRELTAELAINSGKANRARINTSPCRRLADLLGVVQSVLFAPEDLALVRGEPAERRRFLDDLIIQRRPLHAGILGDFHAVNRQRAALLKTLQAGHRRAGGADLQSALQSLEVWDLQQAALGAQVVAGRVELLQQLRPHVVEAYRRLAPQSRAASLDYQLRTAEPSDEVDLSDPAAVETLLLDEIGRRRREEIDRGMTLVGPHRDDLTLMLGEQPAKGYASHGETWSFALSLHLAEYALLAAEGTDPVLILDDVFAELDAKRRERLVAVAADAEQVIITAAVGDDLPANLGDAVTGRYGVVMEDGESRIE